MSYITVYQCDLENDTNTNKKYKEINNEKIYLQTDYLGNIYLKHNDTYYIVSLDNYNESGVELTKIKNPKKFRETLLDSKFLKIAIKSGIIKTENITLRGKAYDALTTMSEEEREEYMSKNDFMVCDDGCEEKKYFWVEYNDDDNNDDDGDNDDDFWLNGISENNSCEGMQYSDLLFPIPGTFEVIMIKGDLNSKRVMSNTEKKNGYCTNHLIVYTSGKFKTNFVDTSKMGIICLDIISNELTIKPFVLH